ncbi:hypothetical protein GCM10012275_54900 [Longimycelium tulufanense]|uniref:Uncharacterized protein n=1 Tax=Longimycelium tulufanense TaxID=907463 RepID=A0A8J3CHB0_9PSEU|nr:hypothetical protein [Longimycelium tulufanense]GGM77269.1 hypothetical protein GCM10012275_54900 [Longimycelium tulufanense]
MNQPRILVTGSRHWTDQDHIADALTYWRQERKHSALSEREARAAAEKIVNRRWGRIVKLDHKLIRNGSLAGRHLT